MEVERHGILSLQVPGIIIAHRHWMVCSAQRDCFFPVEAAQILETKEYLKRNATICAESYWVLDATGPRLIDFGEIEREIRKVIPPMAGKWGVGPYLAKNLQ